MKKVMEHYGSAIIATMVAMGIFGILFGSSLGTENTFASYLGTMMKTAIFTEATSVRSGNAFDTYMNRTVPVFTMPNCAQIQSGKTISISSVLEAVDAQGEHLDIRIANSWDENFSQTTSLEILENSNLCFQDSGVFWVELHTADREGHRRHSLVRIFANER